MKHPDDQGHPLTLPDYLRPGLDIVFVGYNPGERSARLGHYYAGIGNLFWSLLYESGLVPQPLTFLDDQRILEFNLGLTDLVKRSSRSSADLTADETTSGAAVLREKLLRYRPRIACFNGKGVYERLSGGPCSPGLQSDRLGDSLAFVLPSTSARNGRFNREEKLHYFREVKRCLDDIKAAPAALVR
ncbi:MAG TPA: mismatch-specific DNA-glycosylase [Dehalococcoidia bacterium]|nr:mismatch-specific DNA-glycosylase [Dehalococcoidia bacterium]